MLSSKLATFTFARRRTSNLLQQQSRLLSLLETSKSVASSSNNAVDHRQSLTKIVATIGPKSEQYPVLKSVVSAGMKIMRINFSHATYDEADLRTTNLKKCAGLHQLVAQQPFNLRSVMLDTQGPEIRTGSFPEGKEGTNLEAGATVTLTTDPAFKSSQSSDKVWISYDQLSDTVKEDTAILLDDGAIELRVTSKAGKDVVCRVINTGSLGNKKGVNLPGVSVALPAMSDKDKKDITWGVKNDIDYIAASFVRKPSDVIEIKKFVATLMKEFHPPNHPHPLVISKIEATEALANFEDILAVSDGIMVARGDLGVEIPMETLTNVQKEIVRKCNLAGVPVIVATQMLESMQKNPRPTRAECTDVANAVFDGADCVMLSGESAKGKYPVASVDTMKRICDQAEEWINKNRDLNNAVVVRPESSNHDTLEGMAFAVAEASKNLEATCIIVISDDFATLTKVSKFRPYVPIVTFVPNQKLGRLTQMYRGVFPVVAGSGGSTKNVSIKDATNMAIKMGYCKLGDKVIVLSDGEGADLLSMRVVKAA